MDSEREEGTDVVGHPAPGAGDGLGHGGELRTGPRTEGQNSARDYSYESLTEKPYIRYQARDSADETLSVILDVCDIGYHLLQGTLCFEFFCLEHRGNVYVPNTSPQFLNQEHAMPLQPNSVLQ